MPSPPRFTRRRLCLAGLLLIASAGVGALLLLAWKPPSLAQIAYDRIQVGMTQPEVDSIVGQGKLGQTDYAWYYLMASGPEGRSDVLIFVYFDSEKRVVRKEFKTADPHTLGRPIDQLLRRLSLR
jgi:hypothetical protein